MINLLYITWDPALGIPIGDFTIRFYSLAYVIAFILGFYLVKKIFTREGQDLKLLDPLFLYIFIGIILGARLGHVLFYQRELFTQDPLSILLPIQTNPYFKFTGFQGLASHGAVILTIIALLVFSYKHLKGRNPLWLLDRITIPVAIGGALVRIGNFFNSEILGKPFDGAWAVLFKQQSSEYGAMVPRHAGQLYEAIGYVLLFIMLLFIYYRTDKRKYMGWMFGFFCIVLFGVRMFAEYFKEPQPEETIAWLGMNTGQVLSVPFMFIGLYCIMTAKNRYFNR